MTKSIKEHALYPNFIQILNSTPLTRALSDLYYKLAILLVKQAFKSNLPPSCNIWIRNSVQSKTAVFGLSDIDITIVINKRLEFNKLKKFFDQVTLLKNCFPFLGEINSVDENELGNFIKYCNPLEIRRDPNLFKFSNSNISKDKAYSYILRCFTSDLHHLKLFPNLRIKKWFKHVSEVENFSDFKPTKMTKLLPLSLLNSLYMSSEVNKIIELFFENINPLNLNERQKAIFILLFPNKAYDVTINNKTNNQLKIQLNDLLKNDYSFLFSNFFNQLEWEIWGLFTQLNSQKLHGLKIHIDFMKEITIFVGEVSNQQIRSAFICDGFDNLLSYNCLTDINKLD